MSKPVATQTKGFICYGFPDVCWTPVGSSQQPVPYPNSGDLADIQDSSANVWIRGKAVVHKQHEIPFSTGDEAGTGKGIKSNTVAGPVRFTRGSQSVYVNGFSIIRMFDPTLHNDGNANGNVLSGDTTVFAGD